MLFLWLDVLPKLEIKGNSSVLDKSERKVSGQGAIAASRAGAVRARKGFTLFISNDIMDDIVKNLESIETSSLLNDGVTETVKHEIKKQEGGLLGTMIAPMAASLIVLMVASFIQPLASSLINALSGQGVMRARKGQEGGFLPLLTLPLITKAMCEKGVTRTVKGYNNMDYLFLVRLHPLSNIDITKYFNYKPRFHGAFSRDNLPRIKDGA